VLIITAHQLVYPEEVEAVVSTLPERETYKTAVAFNGTAGL
jgi:acyl-CoA synthetase (AMP-forming)/AMP-acid ligase II